jgi:hypothetical protein
LFAVGGVLRRIGLPILRVTVCLSPAVAVAITPLLSPLLAIRFTGMTALLVGATGMCVPADGKNPHRRRYNQ